MTETRTCALDGCDEPVTGRSGVAKYCSRAHGQLASNRKRKGAVDVKVEAKQPDEAAMIETLQSRGYSVLKESKVEPRVKLAHLKTKRYRLGVISDTHMGSMFHQRTYMQEFCDAFAAEGCEAILHAGDLVHGSSNMHKGMEFEVAVHGAHAQTAYAVENFPNVGLPIYIIDGNHDLSFLKDAGAYVVRDFADKRDDVTYLGSEGAYFEIGGASIYLWHGGSGAYAKSYNLQKWAEAVAPEEKPHIVLDGHLHFQCHVHHRGIECFQLPCLQAQTPFEKRKRLHPVIGALILDLWVSRNGLEDVATKWLVRRVAIPNDY